MTKDWSADHWEELRMKRARKALATDIGKSADPPEAINAEIFQQKDRDEMLIFFFDGALRNYDMDANDINIEWLESVFQSGVLGEQESVCKAASRVIASRTKDFLDPEGFIEEGGLRKALEWLINHQWCSLHDIQLALDGFETQHRQDDMEQILKYEVSRLETLYLEGRLNDNTAEVQARLIKPVRL